MFTARITAAGGWIDVAYDPTCAGAVVSMSAVGPPLRVLVAEPGNLKARQKRTDERGRYRRMAVDALCNAGAPDDVADAEFTWSHRAG